MCVGSPRQGSRVLLDEGATKPAAAQADTIVLVDADPREPGWIGEMVTGTWRRRLRLVPVAHPSDAARELLERPEAWVLLDLASFHADRIGLITQVRTLAPQAPIVVVADHADEDEGVAAIRAGAQDYLVKPELYPAQLHRARLHAAERKRI